MTMRNGHRVGDDLQLLSKGLAPFLEREFRTACGDDWVVAVLEADPNAHPTNELRRVMSGLVRTGGQPREHSL
jgi:hypothetical protein